MMLTATSRPATDIEVPEEWKAKGYSGRYACELVITLDADEADLEENIPKIVHGLPAEMEPGWLCLSLDFAALTGVAVRADADAVLDVLKETGL